MRNPNRPRLAVIDLVPRRLGDTPPSRHELWLDQRTQQAATLAATTPGTTLYQPGVDFTAPPASWQAWTAGSCAPFESVSATPPTAPAAVSPPSAPWYAIAAGVAAVFWVADMVIHWAHEEDAKDRRKRSQ